MTGRLEGQLEGASVRRWVARIDAENASMKVEWEASSLRRCGWFAPLR